MDLPKFAFLGPHMVSITTRQGMRDDPATRAYGLYEGEFHHVTLDADLYGAHLGTTLIHEFVEAVNDECDLKLKHSQVSTLGVLLYQLLSSAGLLTDFEIPNPAQTPVLPP